MRREIAGILQVLDKLHRGQMLHRDLTPLNVFVCDNRKLKLGDFGIVRQQNDRRGITTRTLNPRAWRPARSSPPPRPSGRGEAMSIRCGQLVGMLVKGDARARIKPTEVRSLDCSDHLKGDHPSLHWRAPQTLRERRRADRGAVAIRPRC